MERKFFIPKPEVVHEVADDELPPDRWKILILDDDDALSSLLKDHFSAQGQLVTTVKTGVEGIKHVMATEFDIILCDMVMPTMPGDMFFRAVERVRPHLCKRFIFMTGHRGDAKIEAFIRSVKGLVLYKPFELHTLTDYLQAVVKKSQAAGTAK
jgi:CheY-like chemotaxis protein